MLRWRLLTSATPCPHPPPPAALGVWYSVACSQLSLPVDAALRERLRAVNDAEISRLEAAIADARIQHGDVEVGAAVIAKAVYLASIGEKEVAIKAYEEMPEKSLSTGGKADVAMTAFRIALAHGDKKCGAN
jgi:hypothetical protein